MDDEHSVLEWQAFQAFQFLNDYGKQGKHFTFLCGHW